MISPCPVAADSALVPGLIGSVDCAAEPLLVGGYAALAAPGGPVAATITGLLTLFIGFYAFRLLMGRAQLNVGETAVAAIKIGLVLVLAGNWAAYQHVVGRTLFDAPDALAKLMLGGFGPQSSVLSNDSLEALQQAFDEIMRDVRSLSGHAGERSPLLGGAAFATMMLNGGGYALVLSGAGVLAAARIGLALLLALGPVVAGFMLFDATRGLVEGWLRAMVALSLGSLTTLVLIAVELVVIEPTLIALAEQRLEDAIRPETAMKIVILIVVFMLAKVTGLIGAATIAKGIRLPAMRVRLPGSSATATANAVTASSLSAAAPSHVSRIAAAIGSSDRRGEALRTTSSMSIQTMLATTDRYRQAIAGVDGPTLHSQSHRATRPRRELLISRRKR